MIGFFVFFSCTYLFSSEYFSLSPSKGEVLVFKQDYRRRRPIAHPEDEEAAAPASLPGETPSPSLPGTPGGEKTIKIQKQTVVFHWRDLCYDIVIKGEERRILDRVDGWVKPGTLTALMVSVPPISLLV